MSGVAGLQPGQYADLWFYERLYVDVLERIGGFHVVTSLSFLFLILIYVGTSLPYWIIDYFQPAFLTKYKIQQDTHVSTADTWKCIKRLIFNHLVLALPLNYLSYPILEWRGLSFDFPAPTWYELLGRVCIYFFIEDLWFFVGHWLLHTPWAYRNIHAIHHEFNTPIAMASSYAHPVEFIFLGVGTFLGPIIIGGGHIFSVWVWLFFRQVEAIEVHCGYDFPWHLNHILPIYCGPFHHDYHHYSVNGNFASTFVWWDRIFGTDHKYRAWVNRGGHKSDKARLEGISSSKNGNSTAAKTPLANGGDSVKHGKAA